jgi:hypothetical protein
MRKYVPSDYMVDAITNAIDERDGEYVKAEDLPHWIPVSERLPEELTTVLVFHPDAPFAPSGIDLASQMDGDSWMLSDGRLAKPTHWMPLPEPPEVSG